jgi:hypothetical protein
MQQMQRMGGHWLSEIFKGPGGLLKQTRRIQSLDNVEKSTFDLD